MNKYRTIALKLMLEQLENTAYSLERQEYESLTEDELQKIEAEIYKVRKQFKLRYKIDD